MGNGKGSTFNMMRFSFITLIVPITLFFILLLSHIDPPSLTCRGYSESITLNIGPVVDNETGEAIAGVNVEITGGYYWDDEWTDHDGTCSITLRYYEGPSKLNLTFDKINYYDVTIQITITGQREQNIGRVSMDRIPIIAHDLGGKDPGPTDTIVPLVLFLLILAAIIGVMVLVFRSIPKGEIPPDEEITSTVNGPVLVGEGLQSPKAKEGR